MQPSIWFSCMSESGIGWIRFGSRRDPVLSMTRIHYRTWVFISTVTRGMAGVEKAERLGGLRLLGRVGGLIRSLNSSMVFSVNPGL